MIKLWCRKCGKYFYVEEKDYSSIDEYGCDDCGKTLMRIKCKEDCIED